MIKVGVLGAAGRMGRLVCATVQGDPDLALVAAINPGHAEEDVEGLPVSEQIDELEVACAFEGHELCTSKPWVNSLQVRNHLFSFHPNDDGNAEIAKRVSAAIKRET